MNQDRPSETALHVAMHRAAHQVLDDPRIFEDPLAFRVLGPKPAAQLETDPRWVEQTPMLRLLRASLAARSRCAEDLLGAAVGRGVRQYVILGAGLDTFACRNPYAELGLTVFEVDHPATQRWKRHRLDQAGIPIPNGLVFAPVDFETETLPHGLLTAGFQSQRTAFFSWLGVTPYLSVEAITATLGFVLTLPRGSGIVFDYMVAPELLPPPGRRAFETLAQWAAGSGEPFVSCFDPAVLTEQLHGMGFTKVIDLSPSVMNARYFQGRNDGLRVGSLTHVLIAEL